MLVKFFRQLAKHLKNLNYQRLRKRRLPERLAYQQWVQEFDTPSEVQRHKMYEELKEMRTQPLISVLMPVYNPSLEWLKQAIQSVRDQIYPWWELCIADDCSTRTEHISYLQDLSRQDTRIKFMVRATNGHISECSNSALELCSGAYVALIDQDDIVPCKALLRVAQCIETFPEVSLIYSDEDKIGLDGLRESPTLKPDWHPRLLSEKNIVSHLGVYDTDLVRVLGGFRIGFEGAQDHDLALRVSEHLHADQIHHIPEILYHWRLHENSTSNSIDAKPYALVARKRCLKEHAIRTGGYHDKITRSSR